MLANLNTIESLSKEQVKQVAPSVFTKTGSSTVSDKYSHIPTERVLDDMAVLGWNVVDAKEIKARKNQGFQKHMLVFANPEIVINGADGDTVFPRILLTNSHDGKNAFTFQAGLFRLVCSNGLVIADEQFSSMKIRHMGYDFEALQKLITEMVEKLPLTVESMNNFKNKQLSEEQKQKFALEALGLRFDTENKTFNVDEFLTPTRKEDEGNDLWSVFNVIQEKLVHGMVDYQAGSKQRKARRIKNFQQDIKLNSELYELALAYAQ
jgi:hypothetical protein